MIQRNTEVVSAMVGDEAVLLLPSAGVYFALNPVAARIWQLLEGDVKWDDIVELLLQEFEVDRETLTRDLHALLQQLSEKNLITTATG